MSFLIDFSRQSFCLLFMFGIFLPLSQVGFAQDQITVRAKGTYFSSDLTPQQTRRLAIEEAKREALVKAGITETISFTDFNYQFENNQHFAEIFQSISTIETGGEIIVDKIINEKKSFNQFGNMELEVEIEATIFVNASLPDPGFQFNVSGIDRVYSEGDFLKFDFLPLANGYLKIFNITDTEAETYLLYPYTDKNNQYLNDDPERYFVKHQNVVFPMHPLFDHGYTLELENKERPEEFSILLFVFTKHNYPFMDDVNFVNVMKWVYGIPADQRSTEQIGFIIKKK
jgi:hypothetical protein